MHYKESWGSILDKKISCHTKERIGWEIALLLDVKGDQTKKGETTDKDL